MNKTNIFLKVSLLLIAILGSSFLLYKTTASANKARLNSQAVRAARLGDHPTIRSTVRPTPSINFSEGREILSDYDAPQSASAALENNNASPLALTSADFDKDGAPDLICAYQTASGGLIVMHRGNRGSIHPNNSQASQPKPSDAPFLSPARAFEIGQSPDFIGAGDFDADGNQDLIVASRGSDKLLLLLGDGQSALNPPKAIELPGAATALATGDVNRADGLADIVVGVIAADGPKALVFESLEGASRAIPEAFDLPSQIAALALGRMDDDFLIDIAVAAGNEALVISGRDRNSLEDKGKTKQPRISSRRFASGIRSIAAGSFIDKDKPSLAVLTEDGALRLLGQSGTKKKAGKKSGQINQWNEQTLSLSQSSAKLARARLSCAQTDSLVAIDSVSHQMRIIADDPYAHAETPSRKVAQFDVEGDPVAALPIRLNPSALDNLVILRKGQSSPSIMAPQVMMTFTVTDTSDAGVNSFRGAIQAANANPGLDEIDFNVGVGPITINMGGPLPIINDPVIINGNTQPGFAGSPIVELNGTAVTGDGLVIFGGNTTVSGLVINRFGGSGISLFGGNNQVALCFIGTDISGALARGNGQRGVLIGSSNNVVGIPNAGNLLSANGASGVNSGGVVLTDGSGNLIQGNLIGTDVTGSNDLGNAAFGVDDVGGGNNIIGGNTAAARNVISGNDLRGIELGNSSAGSNLVQGNFIGTNAAGTGPLPNASDGILLASPDNTVGGAAAGAGNLISGNGAFGVAITGANSQLLGNLIGTNAAGVSAVSNALNGINIQSSGNIIGNSAAGARNVVSGNDQHGIVFFTAAATGNQISGNLIGTDITGTAALGNAIQGVLVLSGASNNIIGGTAPGAGNVISGNKNDGLQVAGPDTNNTIIQGNLIGTDITGTAVIGNARIGALISFAAANTIIGGTTPEARNVISGNDLLGLQIANAGTSNTTVQGNFIGTDVNGVVDLGNTTAGVLISLGAANTTIGGTNQTARNIISGNNTSGIQIKDAATSGNIVQGNFIGVDANGLNALGNAFSGIELSNGATNNTIGGLVAGARNVISGNTGPGVIIGFNLNPTNNQIQGNFIGTNAGGNSAIANGAGIVIQNGDNITIGGANPAARNVISGNDGSGIQASGSGILVQNNFVGTDATGNFEIGNSILGFNGGGGNLVIRNNIFSGNHSGGILVSDSPGAIIQSNIIGADISGTQDFGNGEEGIDIGNSPGAIIGGAAAQGNIIAFNHTGGILVESGAGQNILSNSIFSNTGLGIDLGGDGVTPNDAGDADAGANNLQNFPALTSAVISFGSTIVKGSFNSAPNTTFTLQFFSNAECDESGFGEGQKLIATRTIQTDPGGNALINFTLPGNFNLPVTATATDPNGNTSEFSPCAAGPPAADLAITKSASPAAVNPGDTLTYTIVVTNQSATEADNVIVADNLPPFVTFVSCAATGNGFCAGSGNNRRVIFNTLPAGSSAAITLTTTVNASVTKDTIIVNTATVSADNADPNAANNSATTATTMIGAPSIIQCPANISITAGARQCSAIVQFPLPTIVDTRFNVTIACSPPSGANFPVGVTTVNCLARDGDAIRGACSFTATVTGGQSATVTLEGGAAALSFGPAEARRKTKKPEQGCDCDSSFTIENTGCAPLNLALDSIMRAGSDVASGRISNPDDSNTFFVSILNGNQGETALGIGAIVTIPVGQTRSFRVQFKPRLPVITGKSTGLSAADLLPDVITSKITFKQNGVDPIVINLNGRISTDVRIVNPDDARAPKRAQFTKSGNEFTVIFGVFDADLDVNRATFEFLDGNGQVVQQAFDVDIAQPISQNNIIRGQSFVITQKFTGATDHPEVASVRVKVSDPHSSDSVTARLGSSSASSPTTQSARGAVILPARKLESLP